MKMHSVSSIHLTWSYRSGTASFAPLARGGPARVEGLRLLLSHCDHTTLVKAGLQPSHHFWAGFMFDLGDFCGHVSCPTLLCGALAWGYISKDHS